MPVCASHEQYLKMHLSVFHNKVHTKTPQSYHYSQVFMQMFFKQMLNFSKPIMS